MICVGNKNMIELIIDPETDDARVVDIYFRDCTPLNTTNFLVVDVESGNPIGLISKFVMMFTADLPVTKAGIERLETTDGVNYKPVTEEVVIRNLICE
jgi:hypothetical protein